MQKKVLYQYLGTNGTILSPVHLEDIYYVRYLQITADINKLLTKDNKNFYSFRLISEDELNDWYEIDNQA